MHVEAFVLLKPSLHLRVFVRGIIVHDQMQLKMPGGFAIDLFEKLQPLLMPVLALDTADQTPLKIIQCGEQGDGAVTNIIVRLRADMPDPNRSTRLRAFQGLNLAFLIAAEHQRFVWRVEIQPDHIPELLFEMRIIGQFEGTGQMRFQVVGGPKFVHAGGRNSSRSGRASAAPPWFTDARLSDLLKDTTHSIKGQKRFTAPTRLIEQTVQPLSLKALTPAGDNGE
jgi:hypothetical protein